MSRDLRRTELGAIHAGKKALGLDDDRYRDLLENATGKRSAAELSPLERGVVLDAMRKLGFRRSGRSATYTGSRQPATSQAEKAEALWGELVALGAVRDASAAGFRAFVERQTGKSRLDWCTPVEMNRVIEGLKAWLARTRAKTRGGLEGVDVTPIEPGR